MAVDNTLHQGEEGEGRGGGKRKREGRRRKKQCDNFSSGIDCYSGCL